MAADDFDPVNEALEGVIDELDQADRGYVAGETISGAELRCRYGLS